MEKVISCFPSKAEEIFSLWINELKGRDKVEVMSMFCLVTSTYWEKPFRSFLKEVLAPINGYRVLISNPFSEEEEEIPVEIDIENMETISLYRSYYSAVFDGAVNPEDGIVYKLSY